MPLSNEPIIEVDDDQIVGVYTLGEDEGNEDDTLDMTVDDNHDAEYLMKTAQLKRLLKESGPTPISAGFNHLMTPDAMLARIEEAESDTTISIRDSVIKVIVDEQSKPGGLLNQV